MSDKKSSEARIIARHLAKLELTIPLEEYVKLNWAMLDAMKEYASKFQTGKIAEVAWDACEKVLRKECEAVSDGGEDYPWVTFDDDKIQEMKEAYLSNLK